MTPIATLATEHGVLQFSTVEARQKWLRFRRMDLRADTVSGVVIHCAGNVWNCAPIREYRPRQDSGRYVLTAGGAA